MNGLARWFGVLVLLVATFTPRPVHAGAALLPDVIEEVPHHLQIHNAQQRELLRFSTTHINIGAGNLQIRGGGQVAPCEIDGVPFELCTIATQELLDASGAIVASQPAGVAIFHPEHNHWHQAAVAEFRIVADDPVTGPEVTRSVKVSFCFVDVEFTGETGKHKKQQPRTYFDCNGELQGLASGWADSYHQSTPLQSLDITGVPDGTYYLTHLADPEDHWSESNEDNNFTWLEFRLESHGGNRKVVVGEHSECIVAVQCGFGGNP